MNDNAVSCALDWKADRLKRPLAYATLWDQAMPHTSQRRAFQNMGELGTLILGGNRSGKTVGASQYAAAVAHGAGHPDARIWARANGVPLSSLPPGPGVVWASALSSGDSRETLRPAISAYLPPDSRWRNRDGFGRAEVILPNGGRIAFFDVSAGRSSYQGGAIDLAFFDEEPAGPNGRAVMDEAMMRLTDRRGKFLLSMTPLLGFTWIYDRWVNEGNRPADVRCHWLHGLDNPHLAPGALERMLRNYGEHERRARELGEFAAISGRVYSQFARHLHVIRARPVDPEWPRYMCVDFGSRNPTAILMTALDPADDTLHVIGEWYHADRTMRDIAAALQDMANHGGPAPQWTIADPADRQARMTLAREYGIPTIGPAGGKDIRARINAISERLRPGVNGLPALVIHDNCPHTIREFEGYIWATGGAGNSGLSERPRKTDDHCMDALGMLVRQLSRATFGVC